MITFITFITKSTKSLISSVTAVLFRIVASAVHTESTMSENTMAGKALVHRLAEYAYKVLHGEMDAFFREHAASFDQDVDIFKSGAGESLNQHSAYQAYFSLLDEALQGFVTQEGFDSAEACFEAVQKAAAETKGEEEAELEALNNKIAAELNAQSGDRVEAGPGMRAPLPIPLEIILKQVGALGEYETFSIMIRAKAAQLKLEAETKAALEHTEPTPEERIKAGESVSVVFTALRERMCTLTPNRSDIVGHVEKMLSDEQFAKIANAEDGWRELAIEQLRFTCFHLDHLASPPHREAIFKYFNDTKAAIEGELESQSFVEHYLEFVHDAVLRVQREIADAFEKRNINAK